MIATLAFILAFLGVGQLYAGADGVEPICVRVGQVFLAAAGILFLIAIVA